MNILVDEAVSATCQAGYVTVCFKSGHELKFPIHGNPRLEQATHEDLNQIELSPFVSGTLASRRYRGVLISTWSRALEDRAVL